MITFSEALKITQEHAFKYRLAAQDVPLEKALGRILAKGVVADRPYPPFDKAAVDGYACRGEDIKNELTVVEMIPAGVKPKKKIGLNECAKIMTGAVVPEGATGILRVEDTATLENGKIKFIRNSADREICTIGEDAKKGALLIESGLKILPQHIAVLASVGAVKPKVSKMPRVAILSTGDELVEPKKKPKEFQIRNSNSSQLFAQVMECGAQPKYFGIAKDSVKDLDKKIKSATKESDVVLLTGGVSMGDFDLVPGVLKDNHFSILFDRLALKPGRPTTFAIKGNKACFGLPGNSATSFVVFEVLVKPFLYKLMGYELKLKVIRGVLLKSFKRNKTEREELLPVKLLDSGEVSLIDYHGAAHIHAMLEADGFITVPIGCDEIEQGSAVDVRLL